MAEMSHAEAEARAEVEVSSQAKQSKDPRPVYEVGFHVVPTAEEADVAGVVEGIRAELGLGDAEIIAEQFPAKMTLLYTIERALSGKREKFLESYFGWIKFATKGGRSRRAAPRGVSPRRARRRDNTKTDRRTRKGRGGVGRRA